MMRGDAWKKVSRHNAFLKQAFRLMKCGYFHKCPCQTGGGVEFWVGYIEQEFVVTSKRDHIRVLAHGIHSPNCLLRTVCIHFTCLQVKCKFINQCKSYPGCCLALSVFGHICPISSQRAHYLHHC